jgi:TIR domain
MMSAPSSGGVFISYRRQEASGLAGRLYDRLAARFGDAQVFMDVDTLRLGVDFAEAITQAVSTCQVLLAVIGQNWLTATNEEGQRRLDDPDDIVRLEIQAALERQVRVIPVLVEGAAMPSRQQLPESLAMLARRHALVLRHESFHSDADRLLADIEQVLTFSQFAGDRRSSATIEGPSTVTPDELVHRSVGSEPTRDTVEQSGQISSAMKSVPAHRILISYRNEDTAFLASYLANRLSAHFGAEQIVKDIEPVNPNADFNEVIELAVASCHVALVLIGERWLNVTDADGKRRIDNPEDVVRLEVEAALQQGVRTIPVLVDAAIMPREEDLPSSLGQLGLRQALFLRPSGLTYDTERLIRVLDKTLEAHRHQQPD